MKEQLKRTGKKYNYDDGLKYSINLINKYIYSSNQIKNKLIKKNASIEDITKIINYLVNHKLINDYELSKDYVNECINRYKGQNYIKDKLMIKGIEQSIINKLLNNINQNDLLSNLEIKINSLMNKYKDKENIKNRIIRNCLSSGYYMSDVIKIINKLIKDSKIKLEKENNNDLY